MMSQYTMVNAVLTVSADHSQIGLRAITPNGQQLTTTYLEDVDPTEAVVQVKELADQFGMSYEVDNCSRSTRFIHAAQVEVRQVRTILDESTAVCETCQTRVKVIKTENEFWPYMYSTHRMF